MIINEEEIQIYLKQYVDDTNWRVYSPQRGFSHGKSFIGISSRQKVFIKLGVDNRVLQLLSNSNITPHYLVGGIFKATRVAIQEYVEVKHPDRMWYSQNMKTLASLFHTLQSLTSLHHYISDLKNEDYQKLFVHYVSQIKYEYNKALLYQKERDIIKSLIDLYDERILCISGKGLVPSHGDVNSGNILIAPTTTYLVDWETLHFSDPIRDIAHILWWMYPRSQWGPLLTQFHINLMDKAQRERFYLSVSTRALYVYLLFVNAGREHGRRFLLDAQLSASYNQPYKLLE